ncbi:hypothetical protein STENM327S_06647 [Streptomyces tendae]
MAETMSTAVVVLLLLAGLSEAAGRIMPLLVSRPGAARRNVVGLMLTGAVVVEGAVFALWPLTAQTAAELLASAPPSKDLVWTPGLLAPLLFTAVLAFPLLGPFLHLLLCVGVGAGLSGPLASPGWWTSACAWPWPGRCSAVPWRACGDWSCASAPPRRRRCCMTTSCLDRGAGPGPPAEARWPGTRYWPTARAGASPSPRSRRACPMPAARPPTPPRRPTSSDPDGIGKRRVRDSRDGGQLVQAVLARAPELRVLGQIQPYSPLADPLADRPVWCGCAVASGCCCSCTT